MSGRSTKRKSNAGAVKLGFAVALIALLFLIVVSDIKPSLADQPFAQSVSYSSDKTDQGMRP